jgi:antitoxin (DNA-binding transcriptional repressor) of toxin-antitoxin stability system
VDATLRAELHDLVGEAAAALTPADELERVGEGSSVELRREGRPFARLAPDGASFRLGSAVAGAAARTPGAAPSTLGPDWVDFAPAELDRFSIDRAMSWTEFAWRQAAQGAGDLT